MPYSPTAELQSRVEARAVSKMPGVTGLIRRHGSDSCESNIGGRSQVRDSIAQARAELRSRVGTQFARGEFRSVSPIHDTISRHNIMPKPQYQQNQNIRRASIRTEAANDVNLWAREGTNVGGTGKTKWEMHGIERAPGAGLLPKLQDAPAPATSTSDEESKHHKRSKKRHKRNKRKLKSLAKKRARARKKKYAAVKMQRWFRAKNLTTAASTLMQRQVRRYLAGNRVELVRQAREAGVMVAVRSTVQGKSGWYQDFDSQVYFFAVDIDGTWWEVVSEKRWSTYKLARSKELQNVPVLVAWANNGELGSGGLYYEHKMDGSTEGAGAPHQWTCVEGTFARSS